MLKFRQSKAQRPAGDFAACQRKLAANGVKALVILGFRIKVYVL